jgi:hypothetical protein
MTTRNAGEVKVGPNPPEVKILPPKPEIEIKTPVEIPPSRLVK